MNTHIDTLAEWWSGAEHAPFRKGDMLISRREGEPVTYEVYPAGFDLTVPADNVRVLHRVPKPKPAWHDAVAVMARCSNAPEGHREPFIRSEATRDVWAGEAGHARTEDLRDVTPLIEAKVTDEMTLRYLNHSWDAAETELHAFEEVEVRTARNALTAALGLETE